ITISAGQYKFGDVAMPRIDSIAAKAKDGTIWLAITNIDPKHSASVTTDLSGLSIKSASGEVLTAGNVNAVNSFEAPAAVVPQGYKAMAAGGKLVLNLPPASVTVVRLEM
ncbi:MAG TPA: alpha-L-arabinofuranosidase C-terminal domain-containing protein, partial [Sphingobium sp.]|uniref:alpha-L-arabinofuranosidase C-terminal domain-containing protein n=1 Tax=Sphingobium sp. TaxID=1912891 RepID=UPI002ED5F740